MIHQDKRDICWTMFFHTSLSIDKQTDDKDYLVEMLIARQLKLSSINKKTRKTNNCARIWFFYIWQDWSSDWLQCPFGITDRLGDFVLSCQMWLMSRSRNHTPRESSSCRWQTSFIFDKFLDESHYQWISAYHHYDHKALQGINPSIVNTHSLTHSLFFSLFLVDFSECRTQWSRFNFRSTSLWDFAYTLRSDWFFVCFNNKKKRKKINESLLDSFIIE